MIKSLLFILLFGQNPIDSVQFVYPTEILEQAAELQSNSGFEAAIDLYLSVSENDTSYLQVQAALMSAYNAAKQYDKCIAIGKRLKDMYSPHRKDIYIELGNAYLNGGQFEQARDIYAEGLELFPYNYLLHYNLGQAYRNIGDLPEAMSCFQRSACINPFYGSNHVMMGYLSMLQGHTTRALLSYLTFLAIRPDNNSILVFLENLASESVRDEGSVPPFCDNSEFKRYDELIRSRAAMDERFKRKVDFNASIVKQSELLISKLEYDQQSSDFWMQMYVPFYTRLEQEKLVDAFIYFILKSSDNEEVLRWLEKHEKEKSAWIDIANEVLAQMRLKNERELLGEKRIYSHWYFDNNNLSAIGDMADGDTQVGPWAFYHQNSQCSSTGKYDQTGNKIGEWLYYHENGRLSGKEVYDNEGVISEPATYYHENGAVSIVAHYNADGQLDGTLEYYHPCGQLKEAIPVDDGTKKGQGHYYHETGQLKTDYTMVDGELDGDYIHYFQNGQVDRKYTISNALTNGLYQSYYINGQLEEEGQYVNDSLSGDWVGYYEGGEIRYKGRMEKDNRVGRWEYYHASGNVQEVIHYNDKGEKHGENQNYTEEGKLHCIVFYDQDKIIGLKYVDPKGEVLYEKHDAGGNMEYKTYYPTGELLAEGTLENGKLNGPLETYYKNGNLKQKTNTIDDYYDGSFEEYFPTGGLYINCTYKDGMKDGRYLQFHENGALQHDGWYIEDNAEQAWNTYYPDGSLDEYNYYITAKNHGWNHIYAAGNKLHRSYRYEMDMLVGLRQYDTLGNIYHQVDIPHGNGMQVRKSVAGDTLLVACMQCGQFTSDINSYYRTGLLKSRSRIVNGLFEGEYELKRLDGSTSLKGAYKDNRQEGPWEWYHYNGNVSTSRPYLRGVIEGSSKSYYVNGQLESDCNYSAGERDGTCIYYDQRGNHQLTKFYSKEDGHIAYVDVKSKDTIQFNPRGAFTLQSFFENGNRASVQSYMNGKYEGECSWYNIDGSLTEKASFAKGQLHGTQVKYYPNGKVYSETTYMFDNRHGLEKEYFENGKVRRETPYFNNKINGYEIVYNRDGSIKSKIFYWNDEEY